MKQKKPYDRKNSIRCVEYWISRGYTEEEAKKEISARQRRSSTVYKKAADSKKTDEFRKKQSDKMKQVYTEEYWISKLGESNGREKYKQLMLTLAENGKFTCNSFTADDRKRQSIFCVEYWVNKGYTQEDAKNIISSQQSRGLQYFVQKYGEYEGYQRWAQRQINWKISLNNNNNKDEINLKRRLNAHVGLYTEDNTKDVDELCFYLMKVISDTETFLKFGLTKHKKGVIARWGRTKLGAEIIPLLEWRTSGNQAFKLEQEIKRNFSKFVYSPSIFTTTEALDILCESELMSYIMTAMNQDSICGKNNGQN